MIKMILMVMPVLKALPNLISLMCEWLCSIIT
jgi:hypothetical protein